MRTPPARGLPYYAGAVGAAAVLLARALWWGVLGALSVAGWVGIKLADRLAGPWVAPHGFPDGVPPSPPGADEGRGV